jgi:shikimate dehydrogenase
MKVFGLIGYPLGHSFSAGYFTKKFEAEAIKNCVYKNFPLDTIDKFPALFNEIPELAGLNVTIPYKEKVIPFLNEIDAEAKEIGAVNTVKITKSEKGIKLKGYNTDVYGFENSLKPLLNNNHKKALILGTGGASKAIKYILKKLKIEFISASIEDLKENEIKYSEITEEIVKERTLIINATPLGTFPNIDVCPEIPYEIISSDHILFDLVYNPETTLFLKKGQEKGAKTKNGLEMLHLQAERAWKIWNE